MMADVNREISDPLLDRIKGSVDYYARFRHLYGNKENLQLNDRIRRYLTLFPENTPEKKAASAKLLWTLKNYTTGYFSGNAVALINQTAFNMELDDINKIRFLHYMVSCKNYLNYNEQVYRKCSDYDFSTDNIIAQSETVFHKVEKLLGRHRLNEDNFVKNVRRLLPVIDNYAYKCPSASPDKIERTANILFETATRLSYARISLFPLYQMLKKTPSLKQRSAKMFDMFDSTRGVDQSRQIDKVAVEKLAGQYASFIQKRNLKRISGNLNDGMAAMMAFVVSHNDYSRGEVRSLQDKILRGMPKNDNDNSLERVRFETGRAYYAAQPRVIKSHREICRFG